MSPAPGVIVIGGGVIGLTTAYFLARAGVRVAVLDKGDLGQEASWAGAGIIPSGNPRRAHTPVGKFRAHSVALFPELSAELQELTGLDNGYRRCGGVELRRSEEELERRRVAQLIREERGDGAHCELLDRAGLHAREPNLAPDLPGAVHFPDLAQVRNPWHLRALIAACQRLGVDLRPQTPVVGLEGAGGRIKGIRYQDGLLRAERFLVAAGPWSGQLLESVGWRAAVRPVRGQIALLHAPPGVLRGVVLAGSEYLVPREDGRVLVGSTEEEAGFAKQTTAEAITHLLTLAVRLVPCLRAAAVEKCWAGLRPGTADGRPYLGRVPGWENLFVATGHFRSGILLSPATGLVMKQLLLDEAPNVPLDPFRPDR